MPLSKIKIFSNFVAFTEYLNFTGNVNGMQIFHHSINLICWQIFYLGWVGAQKSPKTFQCSLWTTSWLAAGWRCFVNFFQRIRDSVMSDLDPSYYTLACSVSGFIMGWNIFWSHNSCYFVFSRDIWNISTFIKFIYSEKATQWWLFWR